MTELENVLERRWPETSVPRPAPELPVVPDAQWIDDALLRRSSWRWQNAAVLVTAVVADLPATAGVLDPVLVVGRIGTLLRRRRLELRGDLGQLRHCEVRLGLY